MSSRKAIVVSVVAAAAAFGAMAVPPGASPGPGIRYATDAYPGFDSEDEIIKPSRTAPRWFSWFTGPKRDTAAEQFAYAAELEGAEEWRAARKAYDALVRNWPASPEAPKAQKAVRLSASRYRPAARSIPLAMLTAPAARAPSRRG